MQGFGGTVNAGGGTAYYFTSFPAGLRFRCLPGCGRCCAAYRIPVTRRDMTRLREAGYDADRAVRPAENAPSEIEGYINEGVCKPCVFLNAQRRCDAYAARPLYCRTYPFIRDAYGMLEISVDYSCPGVGSGDPVRREDLERWLADEMEQAAGRERLDAARAAFSFSVEALKQRGVFMEQACMTQIRGALVQAALEAPGATAAAARLRRMADVSGEVLRDRGNVTRADTARRVAADVLGAAGNGSASGPAGGALTAEAGALFEEYMDVWGLRQGLLRYAHAMGVAGAGPDNVFVFYADFIGRAATEVLHTAEALRVKRSEDALSTAALRDAITARDAGLRGQCTSMIQT
ncbi:MAG: YkgJ family cysteine cluster protein [Lentisphaerae bacterium]|nr:YkgJ family cysteine cluster protein [Lentisphaerota bacterium]